MNIIKKIPDLLKWLLFLIGLYYILAFIFIVISRINYPFELEWMEGSMVDHIARILAGKGLYQEPSIEFTPFIYAPLYFYCGALFSKLFGIGFFSLRLLSTILSLGCFYLIFLIVKKETNNNFYSFLSVSLFLATYRLGGAWFDIARVDMMCLFFGLLTFYLVRLGKNSFYFLLAGICAVLATLTKQTAIIMIAPLIFYCLAYCKIKHTLYFSITSVFLFGTITMILNYYSKGWYFFYLFDLPRLHTFIKYFILDFWTTSILKYLALAFIFALFYLFYSFNNNKRTFLFSASLFSGMIISSYLSRIHSGGWDNVLIPAYAGISILLGLSLNAIINCVSKNKNQNSLESIIYLLIIIQFSILFYNPFAQIPTKKDFEIGNKFINYISKHKGDIYIPNHGYYHLAKKKSYAHGVALLDLTRIKSTSYKNIIIHDLDKKFAAKEFSLVVIDRSRFTYLLRFTNFKKYYKEQESFIKQSNAFWPVTGYENRPELFFVPK